MTLQSALAEITCAHMGEYNIPGVAIAVVKDGQITHETGFGLANIEKNLPAGPATVWPICSLTKSMTCTAVMQLVEQGLVDINEPVHTYLPSWRTGDPDASSKITVKMLMHHGSGMGRMGFQNRVWGEKDNPYPTRESVISAIADVGLQSEPGHFWAYSNEAFVTLGFLVETISNIRLEDYFLDRIFKPLGMSQTVVRFADWQVAPDHVVNYIRYQSNDDGSDVDYEAGFLPDDYQAYLSTGGICSTAHDLALYQSASMQYDSNPLLTRKSLELMQSIAFEYGDTGWGYGFGWSIFNSGRKTHVVGHGGALAGISTYSLFVPEEQIGVVVLLNRSDAGSFELAEQLLGEVRGAPLWRDSLNQPLGFQTNFSPPEDEPASAFDGQYAHEETISHIVRIDGGIKFKLASSISEDSEGTAMRVGPESFLVHSSGEIMQFPSVPPTERGKSYLQGGNVWTRID
jgi:CubicO group peptidase (beta-lactamase class C family)